MQVSNMRYIGGAAAAISFDRLVPVKKRVVVELLRLTSGLDGLEAMPVPGKGDIAYTAGAIPLNA